MQLKGTQNTSNENAIQNYYLSSVIPFQMIPHPIQFPKSRQFYKPQQFIWNNPHRTSKRLYPYYHKDNDNYMINIKPKIQEMIYVDRKQQQNQRIRRLSQKRQQTLNKFHSRQQVRKNLQSRACSNQKKLSKVSTEKAITYGVNQGTCQTRPQNANLVNQNKSINSRKCSLLQKSYQYSQVCFDEHMCKVRRIFTQQIEEKHKKIRNDFKVRKQWNEVLNCRISNKKKKSLKI